LLDDILLWACEHPIGTAVIIRTVIRVEGAHRAFVESAAAPSRPKYSHRRFSLVRSLFFGSALLDPNALPRAWMQETAVTPWRANL